MEKAHDISIDEPCVAHQAILFMLDVLMRNNKPTLSLADLYDSFGDKSFTPQMLRAVGGNEQGLKQFLLRYPSLFTVNGDQISANSGGNQLPRTSTTPDRYLRKPTKNKSTSNGCTIEGAEANAASGDLNNTSPSACSSSNTIVNGNGGVNGADGSHGESSKTMKEIEQEAIAFFRKQISKREEDWLPIVSVAGHASQSSSDVRKFVGPQNEFKQFLLKYPHIFVVKDEYCGLKGKADVSSAPFPPPSPPPKRRQQSTISMAVANSSLSSTLSRNHSFKQTNRYSTCNLLPNSSSIGLINASSSSILNQSNASTPTSMMSTNSIANSLISSVSVAGVNSTKPRLTPVEVKAVHYVMRILHKNGRMLLQTIPGLISRAPDQVSNIVGFTREDLIQFFKRHSAIFQLHPDGCVSVKQDAVKALILKDASNANNSSSLANSTNPSCSNLNSGGTDCAGIITSNGVVLRIFPKYGILNMDNNEQVFFDIQSCQFETFSDLTTILHTGDRLYFNAVIGPRDGSTKWRSIKTWIKMKPQTNGVQNGVGMLDNLSSHSDADKSDDSSTSSLSGNNNNNGNSFRHSAFQQQSQQQQQQQFSFNASQQQAQLAQPGQFYATSPTSPPPLASSPTGTLNNVVILNGTTSSQSPSINSTSTSSSSTPSSAIDNDQTTTSIANTPNSTPTNVVAFGNGDFNQYQLDLSSATGDSSVTLSGSVAPTALSSSPNDNNENETASGQSYLIHSSSASNLHMNKLNSTLINSKSIHSFNIALANEQQASQLKRVNSIKPIDEKTATGSAPGAGSTSGVTKFMKQSPDNISQREVTLSPLKAEIELISIGCQTISTGDITVTNVYIE